MASVRDILPRAERLGAGVVYQGAPAAWLLKAARAGAPVVINCKGVAASDTPVIITLAEYERLKLGGGGE